LPADVKLASYCVIAGEEFIYPPVARDSFKLALTGTSLQLIAQKFISDPGQQNGLYWESAQSAPRSPLGPHVAFASDEETTIKPDKAQPFYGYYFRQLENQGPDAKGGAKSYLVKGKMTGGFAYVAYPVKYGDTVIQTFIINQDGVVFEKDLGKDTVDVATKMTGFNPDKTWTELK
jgi:Protein of unknown function (DUF2950)